MGMDQSIVVDFGVIVEGKEAVESFADKFVKLLEEADAGKTIDLEEVKYYPGEAYSFMANAFPGVDVSNIHDEGSDVVRWVISWRPYSKRVDNRYESYAPVILEPVAVPEVFQEFLNRLNVTEKPAWVFYAYVN